MILFRRRQVPKIPLRMSRYGELEYRVGQVSLFAQITSLTVQSPGFFVRASTKDAITRDQYDALASGGNVTLIIHDPDGIGVFSKTVVMKSGWLGSAAPGFYVHFEQLIGLDL